jgi:uncharacterized protein GlcG (DUF336 family)
MSCLLLSQANAIIVKAFSEARSRSMPPLAAAILDPGGHLRALQREDGASFLRAELCVAKAWGALAMGVGSRQLAERYLQGTQQEGFINALNAMTGGRVVPLPGGVLIRDADGNLQGALGLAGGASEDDEVCAVNAIESAGLTAVAGEG